MTISWQDVRAFAALVWKDWVALMSGLGGIVFSALGAAFAGMPSSVFWALAIVCFVVAMLRVWQREFHDKQRAQEELRPRLEILPETWRDPTTGVYRARVRSLSGVGCQFGLDLVAIAGPATDLTLPMPLRVTFNMLEVPLATLPPGQSRAVDVLYVNPHTGGLIHFAGSHGNPGIPAGRYELTLLAHCDQGGAVSRIFLVDATTEPPRFEAKP